MADIFLNKRGVVSAFDYDLGIPCNMFLDGWGGFYGFKSIITEFTYSAQGGVQFMHTLREFIYLYVFGERISSMRISGLSFWDTCDGGGIHGLEYVNSYYLNNRVSQLGTPITIVFGGATAFYGFLTNLTISLNNPQDLMGQYALDFKVVPQQNSLDGTAAGEDDSEDDVAVDDNLEANDDEENMDAAEEG